MNTLFVEKGELPYESREKRVSIPLNSIPQDISIHKELIVYREEEQFHVYDRKCDHNGGKLCLMDNKIKCPMHDWEFDPRVGKYSNIQIKKTD